MPRFDGTGPLGQGPMTGHGMGYCVLKIPDGMETLRLGSMTGRAARYCAGYSVPGYMNPIPGRPFGWFGRGFGRGRRWFGW